MPISSSSLPCVCRVNGLPVRCSRQLMPSEISYLPHSDRLRRASMAAPGVQHGGDHEHSAPARSPLVDSDTYRIMVLRFEQSEEEVDDALMRTALDLDIDVSRPSSRRSSIAEVVGSVSTLDIEPTQPEVSTTPEPPQQTSSQTSGSSNTQSDSSAEYRRHTKTPSLTATSNTSVPSITSASSQSQLSHRAKIKKRIRRISTLHRRKVSIPVNPASPIQPLERASQITVSSSSPMQPHALTADEPATLSQRRHVSLVSSISATSAAPKDPSSHISQEPKPIAEPRDEPQDLDDAPPSPATLEAQHRSINHPVLKKLRTSQLQEQLRFISFQASQTRLLRTAHVQTKRNALAAYKACQFQLETVQADALVSLEHRHLNAEVDLRKGLESESKNCDVKLKHMQAYCNPRKHVEGMPRREVTEADYRQLEQQYHIRNTMENLHTSKINVLREKQAKQLERIMAKQQLEIEKIEADFEQEKVDLDQRFREEIQSLSEEFQQRRKRLVRRWRLMESIERKKLEGELGQEFGALPAITWKQEDTAGPERIDTCVADGKGADGEERSAEDQEEGLEL